MSDFTNAFRFIGDNTHLLWTSSLDTLTISAEALVIALVVAVPLGVLLGHVHRFSFVAINGANIGRALPSLAVVAIALAVLGIGDINLLVALVILAIPPILTNAYVAVDGVDRDAVDAARGMGMRDRDVLLRVELPLALPLLFAGIRTGAVFVVATTPLGALVGASGGLGDIISNQASYHFSGVLGAAICLVALALLTEVVFAGLQRAVTPRGLRVSRRPSMWGPARGIPAAPAPNPGGSSA